MPQPLFTSQTFPVPGAKRAALLFAGYRGTIRGLKRAVQTLNARGYTVTAYAHPSHVLRSGNPHDLLELINAIHKDALAKTRDFDEVLCAGVSVGAGIGMSLQRQYPMRFRRGVYAGNGVSPSQNIFEAPLFYFVRRAFRRDGYDATKLHALWQSHEITPGNPVPAPAGFVMALGKRDAIVRHRKAIDTLQAWQRNGTPIVIVSKNRSHAGIIRWYKRHLGELLDTEV